jgi:peptidoglycan lytic transglycosylase
MAVRCQKTDAHLRKKERTCPQRCLNSGHTSRKRGVGTIHCSDTNLDRSGAVFARGKAFIRRLPRRRTLFYLFASAIVALTSGDVSSAPRHKQVIAHRSKAGKAEHHKKRPVTEAKQVERAPGPRTILTTDTLGTSPELQLSPDLVGVKQSLQLVQQHKLSDATKLAVSIGDPAARKLIAWTALRDPDNRAGFDDYNSFIQTNPDWPIPLLRRRAEARLWQERRDAATVRQFVGAHPASAPGRLALARQLLNDGDRAGAAREVQAVWHTADLLAELETAVANAFHDQLTAADDTVRMDRRIGAKDFPAAMRAAKRAWLSSSGNREGLRGDRGEQQQGRGATRSGSKGSTN